MRIFILIVNIRNFLPVLAAGVTIESQKMIPLRAINSIGIFPWLTVILILLNVTVYIYQVRLDENSACQLVEDYFGAVPERIVSEPFQLIRYHWNDKAVFVYPVIITAFSSLFLHGSVYHLLGNMLYLWIFGGSIEEVTGRFRFFLYYLTCGFLALLTHVFSNPHSGKPVIGASGAIAGVLGGFFLFFPRTRILTLFLFWFFRVPAILFLGCWIALQIFYVHHPSPSTEAVALWAHIGGFLSGVLLIHLFKKSQK